MLLAKGWWGNGSEDIPHLQRAKETRNPVLALEGSRREEVKLKRCTRAGPEHPEIPSGRDRGGLSEPGEAPPLLDPKQSAGKWDTEGERTIPDLLGSVKAGKTSRDTSILVPEGPETQRCSVY